ncbi:nucleotide disphospho-sugar-binding domain-containing protein [Escherichia coli H20]|uniref:glycosyltransferase n=1 Tax=Escherichia coli TaxID=562 RepID=UPI0024A7830C|nr:glycosyltransferase [Escherichia coli]MDO2787346.1 glycosyltransferase [Escherichia coli]
MRKRILFIGPPLYGLLYPLISLAQAFRVIGHDVVISSAGKFANKAAEAGLVVFDAVPGLDSEAGYRHQEELRKKSNIIGHFSFFSDEMADNLIDFAGKWRPDLIVYPPLGPAGPLVAAKYRIPSVMLAVGFAHTSAHIQMLNRSLSNAYRRHGVSGPLCDLAWIDVAPPSMSILKNAGEPVISMRYIPYNGGAVKETWWDRDSDRKRLLISLGTVKPMVDGLELISWVMDSANEVDADIILQLAINARTGLRKLPSNVRLVDWIPMGVFLNGADGFIHHGGAGNTLTALYSGIPQIVFGEGADRSVNAEIVARRGCGIIPDKHGLTSDLVNRLLYDDSLRFCSDQVAAEMAEQPSPAEIAEVLMRKLKNNGKQL